MKKIISISILLYMNCLSNVFAQDSLSLDLYLFVDSICAGDSSWIFVNIGGGDGGPYFLYDSNGDTVTPPIKVSPAQTTQFIFTAMDNTGNQASDTIVIYVFPIPPNNPIADPYSGCAPLEVHFSEPNQYEGQTYIWNFGDNSSSGISTEHNPTHTFYLEGVYDVSLTVTSAFGCVSHDTIQSMITVYPKPQALFQPVPSIILLGNFVWFYNQSNGGIYYHWNFGDGDTSVLESPEHMFSNPGTFNVVLIVTGENGCSDTTTCDFIVLGINETNYSEKINIYPNPANDNLTVESPQNSIIEIKDIQGNIIEILKAIGNRTIIDTGKLSRGIYVLTIITNKRIVVRKLIKQ